MPFPAVTVDAGKVVNPMGYPRKALARTSVDETDDDPPKRFAHVNVERKRGFLEKLFGKNKQPEDDPLTAVVRRTLEQHPDVENLKIYYD